MHVIQSLGQCTLFTGQCLTEVQMDAIKTVTGWDVTLMSCFDR